MKDVIVIDGIKYIREGVKASSDEVVFDDWQSRKVKSAWDAVHRQEQAAREARRHWMSNNPCGIIYGMIAAHYEGDRPGEYWDSGCEETFNASVEEFLRWYEKEFPDQSEYAGQIRYMMGKKTGDVFVPQTQESKSE